MLVALFIALAGLVLAPRNAAAQDVSRAELAPSEVVRSVELAASRVQRLLGSARGGGVPTRVMCVDGRLSELHSLLRLALQRSERMHQATRRGERALAERESALVGRLAARARMLERDARACIDPELGTGADRTRVTVTIEPWVPGDEVIELPPADRRSAFLR